MTKRTSWDDIKATRPDSPARKRGYEVILARAARKRCAGADADGEHGAGAQRPVPVRCGPSAANGGRTSARPQRWWL